jgi:hypothetical protein
MDVDDDDQHTEVEAAVGDKRAAPGSSSARTTRASSQAAREASQTGLTQELERQLCQCVHDMLVAQRYVDEWPLEGVQRWLQTEKDVVLPLELLEQYFDRVDQRVTETVPYVLYDVAEKTVHRDY